VELPLLRQGSLPEGFAYVPPGKVLFGSAADPSVREFFNAIPVHEVSVPGFLIARSETTFADWITFLEAQTPEKRALHMPTVGSAYHGQMRLEWKDGVWRLRMQPSSVPYEARAGEKIRYKQRDQRQEQDWLRMPVSGIPFESAAAYAKWLADTGRVPGARLCTELEWERAARGVDGRQYPHGDKLGVDDANIDRTYGQKAGGIGPDEAGSHPRSASPFGVEDMAGNAWEWTRNWLEPHKPVARGGSYYYGTNSANSANRDPSDPSLRDLTVGLRVCAELPPKP
jgi:formylglycine-generating enzyme required for sulfatase activity